MTSKDNIKLYVYFYFIKVTILWNLTDYAFGHRLNGYI